MSITWTPTTKRRRLLPTFVRHVGVLRLVTSDPRGYARDFAQGERAP